MGADVSFASVEFNLNRAVAAAGSFGSMLGLGRVGAGTGEAFVGMEGSFAADEHIVAIGTGMIVTGIGPIELVPTEM